MPGLAEVIWGPRAQIRNNFYLWVCQGAVGSGSMAELASHLARQKQIAEAQTWTSALRRALQIESRSERVYAKIVWNVGLLLVVN